MVLPAVVAAGPLSVVALIAGWVTTEVGRQPWVVYGLMRTRRPSPARAVIPVGYATLVLVYAGLLVGGRLDPPPPGARPGRDPAGPSGVAPLARRSSPP